MRRKPIRVLIASVSVHERRVVESILKETGLTTVAVDDAEDATRELSADGAAGVLVIDSGLLEAAHDLRWREFRRRHPNVGAAVPRPTATAARNPATPASAAAPPSPHRRTDPQNEAKTTTGREFAAAPNKAGHHGAGSRSPAVPGASQTSD